MKKRLLVFIYLMMVVVGISVTGLGQQSTISPFAELDNYVSRHGWRHGNSGRCVKLFNLERQRLGKRFEPELMKYLGQDPERHYWISLFIESAGYLDGAEPLPHLSLLVKQQALAILEGKEDERSLRYVVSLSVLAAVSSEKLGLHHLAMTHKARAEQLIREKRLGDSRPAMYEEEIKLYDSISSPPSNPGR